MPIKPNPGESKDEYIGRCIGIEINNGFEQDQAAAICIVKADEHFSATASIIDLPPASDNFGRVRRIIFDEDFDEATLRQYKNEGFQIHIKSKRKIFRRDRKTYNKLRSVGLSEDNLVFGEMEDLNKTFEYDLFMTGQDPMLEGLKYKGRDISKCRVISEMEVDSFESAVMSLSKIDDVQLKFAKISVVFTYELKDGMSGSRIIPTSRDFCRSIPSGRGYTMDEINSLPTEHLLKMGLPPDVFAYRGGFHTVKGGQLGPDTTPSCRHTWKSKVIVN